MFVQVSEDILLLVTLLLLFLFRGFLVALFVVFLGIFLFFFCHFLVALVLGECCAYSSWISFGVQVDQSLSGHCSGTPNPYNLSKKCWQYTSNSYCSTLPICKAVPRWLLSLEERETPQYTTNLCCSTPPICTVVQLHLYPQCS